MDGIVAGGQVVRCCHACRRKAIEKTEGSARQRETSVIEKRARLLAERKGEIMQESPSPTFAELNSVEYQSRQKAQIMRVAVSERLPEAKEEPLRALPQNEWVPDDQVSDCSKCQAKFSLVLRRHHCRLCGSVFCDVCAPQTDFNGEESVRFCEPCVEKLQAKWSANAEAAQARENRVKAELAERYDTPAMRAQMQAKREEEEKRAALKEANLRAQDPNFGL